MHLAGVVRNPGVGITNDYVGSPSQQHAVEL